MTLIEILLTMVNSIINSKKPQGLIKKCPKLIILKKRKEEERTDSLKGNRQKTAGALLTEEGLRKEKG